MNDQIEEIKRRIDIVQFISEFIPLKKSGRNFKALCPFHSETVPSFIVSPERQIWHCFGACNEGGDIFKFLMKIENISFGEALKELAKRAGIKLISYQPTDEEKRKQLLYEINHLAAEFYHYLLLHHKAGKPALDYVFGRGIKRESLETFFLGYAPNMWDGVQRFLVGKRSYPIDLLEKTGLVIRGERGRYYDRFRHRLIFPLRDHRGNICGFAGRVIVPEVQEAKYINTPETEIYHKSDLLYGLYENKEEIKKNERVILVEGELDMISSWQVGIKNVVAIKGSALSFRQVQLLSRYTKNLTFALDADIAGDQAARRGIEIADSLGMNMRVVKIEGGKDPDEVAQKNPEKWKELVNKAIPVYDYFIESAFLRFKGETPEEKKQIGEELVPILAKISDKIVQGHYFRLLAERLDVEEEAIAAEVAKYLEKIKKEESPAIKEEKIPPDREEILEEHLLALGFQSANWRWLRKKEVINLVKINKWVRILEALGEYLKRYKTINSSRFEKLLPPELRENFNRLYLLDLEKILNDEEKLTKDFEKTLLQLKEIHLRKKLKEIGKEIARLEKEGGKEELIEKLSVKFRDLGIKLAEISQKE